MNFNELYKVRISNPDDSMRKHDIVKLLIVTELMYRTRKKKKYHQIYTEYPINGRKVDVFHKNLLTNETTIYEIQKEVTTKWKKKLYSEIPDDVNMQIVFLKDLPDNINKLNKDVKEYIII